MRLLCDANISIRVVAHLRHMGYDASSVLEDRPNADDADILSQAKAQERTIITYDKDFGQLVFENGMAHFGVILVRSRDEAYSSCIKILERFFSVYEEKVIQQHFWTLTDSETRQATQATKL